jgi:hypothetical protein
MKYLVGSVAKNDDIANATYRRTKEDNETVASRISTVSSFSKIKNPYTACSVPYKNHSSGLLDFRASSNVCN